MDGQVKVQVTFKTDYEATGLVTKGKKRGKRVSNCKFHAKLSGIV